MYRKGAAALIINDKNEFLLVNLQSFKEIYFAVPGGSVESNESLENAVFREIFEELGITKDKLRFVGKSDTPVTFGFKEKKLVRDGVTYDGQERYFFGFQFLGNDNGIILKEDEVRSYKWVSYENLKDHLLFEGQLEEVKNKIKEIFGM